MTDIIRYRTLGHKVLVVAIKRIEGRDTKTRELLYGWRAYINGVPGQSHQAEIQDVVDYGFCLPVHIAKCLFPEITEYPYSG